MLLSLYIAITNEYNFPDEGWEEDAEGYFMLCLNAGHKIDLLHAICQVAWNTAHERAQKEHYQPW